MRSSVVWRVDSFHCRRFAGSTMSLTKFAKTLLRLAKSLDLTRYRKRRRGPKKPATPRTKYHNGGHASTAKILALRKKK